MEDLKKRILCVDDDPANLDLLEAILSQKNYMVLRAKGGAEALEIMNAQSVDLVLLDVMMPGINGFEVCRIIKNNPVMNHIPVVMVTVLADKQSRLQGLEAGANDFLSKPVDSIELLARTKNLLRIKEFDDFLKDHNKILTIRVAEKTQELRESFIDSIYRLTRAAEYRDDDTACHIQRTGHYTRLLAKEIGCSDSDVDTFFYASPMHDIGKIGVPDAILLKPGKLTAEEFKIMKTHTTIGGQILGGSHFRMLQMAHDIAVSHHEKWNGKGYPNGLAGENIPLVGRILAVVDVFDALSHDRVYHKAETEEEVVRIMGEGRGSHFDRKLFDLFIELLPKIRAIAAENP